MASLPLPSNFTLYSFPSASSSSAADNDDDENRPQSSSQTSRAFCLVDICSEFVVKDRLLMKTAIEVVPKNLFDPLLKAALKTNQDKSSEEIISSWPWQKLVLYDIVPSVFPSFKPLFSKLDLMENVRRGVKYTTSLVHTYMENLKKQKLMKLRWLDLSGFPSVEVIVNYIVAHVLLVYNERNQKEIISFYNQIAEHLPQDQRKHYSTEAIIPEQECTICLDVSIESKEAHMELCRALNITSKPKAVLKLAVSQLDIQALGVPSVVVLLELINPVHFRGANLQYNGISNQSLELLTPPLIKFTNLVSLDISNNYIRLMDSEDAGVVADILANFKHLKRLNLGRMRVNGFLGTILSKLIHPIEMLRLNDCHLLNEDIEFLATNQLTNSINELELSKNNLHQCTDSFFKLLTKLSSSLTILEIEDVQFSSTTLLQCFEKCLLCSNLHYLNVAQNSCLRKDIMESLVYFFVIPELEAVTMSFPRDATHSNGDLDRSNTDFSFEIDKIIYCLCHMHKRKPLKMIFEL